MATTVAQLLEFAAGRLVSVYGEPENVDFVLAMRREAKRLSPSQEPLVLDGSLERGAEGVACPQCGGYASRTKSTDEEIASDLNCGKSHACCCRAFICGVCGSRIVGSADAPEVGW